MDPGGPRSLGMVLSQVSLPFKSKHARGCPTSHAHLSVSYFTQTLGLLFPLKSG